ncbi:MAG TPA: hypothetical protein VLZ50_13845 [Terracidiphilus sp.]|nr:hypothetical protein [Terracidiphilus sp.]
MRMVMHVRLPHEPFNTQVKNGTAGSVMKKILDEQKPEAAYFCEWDGHRSGLLVVDVSDTAQIPVLAEPWFLNFHADVHLRPAMTVEDLGRANLDAIGNKWA